MDIRHGLVLRTLVPTVLLLDESLASKAGGTYELPSQEQAVLL